MQRFECLALATVVSAVLLGGCGSSPGAPTAVPTPQPSPLPSVPTNFDGTRVTFVANAGFLVTVGDTHVLVDSLFDGFRGGFTVPQALQDLLVNARPPFDHVELILVTHDHSDHFNVGPVARHMQANPRAVLVAPSDVAAQITGFPGRVFPVLPAEGEVTRLEVGGIGIEAVALSHGVPSPGTVGIPNVGYVFRIGETRFFHTGDTDPATVGVPYYQSLGIPDEGIDVAFVSHFVLSAPAYHPVVLEGIRPRHLVAMHYEYTTDPPNYALITSYFPSAVLFRNALESWVMP